MKIENIVEGLNRFIEDKRDVLKIKTNGHLVLQRTMKPRQTFKAYKEYKYIIWFVKDGKKYNIITIEKTAKVLDGQEGTILKIMDIELSKMIFNWIGSASYEQVIKGECNGDINE